MTSPLLQQLPQPAPLPSDQRLRQLQAPHVFGDTPLPVSPEVHGALLPERMDGLWFPGCSCGWIGHGRVYRSHADEAVCPRLAAERQVVRDRQEYERSVATAAADARR